ncbi:MAG: hypothetical protein MSG77_07735 [Prevotella sp.]|nr:hypothetical protein [Prevotella sp.]
MNAFKQNIPATAYCQAKAELTKEEIKTLHAISSTFHTTVGSVNDIAHSYLVDAVNEIKKTKHYRHDIKHACKEALERYKNFERREQATMQHSYVDRRVLYMDFLDGVMAQVQGDIFKLYMTIKQHLDRQKAKESKLKAHVFLAHILLDLSVHFFDAFAEAMKNRVAGVDLRGTFLAGRLAYVFNIWDEVVKRLTPELHGKDIDDIPNARLAAQIIEQKLSDVEVLYKAGREAVELNKETAEEVIRKMEEEKRELNK